MARLGAKCQGLFLISPYIPYVQIGVSQVTRKRAGWFNRTGQVHLGAAYQGSGSESEPEVSNGCK